MRPREEVPSAATAVADPPAATDDARSAEELSGEPRLSSHVLQRGIVLERFKILYVPMPKAGCTALLWSLAGLTHLDEDRFRDSTGREVSRALTIHDLSRWPESFRFGERPEDEKREILSSGEWLRFSVGRDPFRRLWSAWQSKLLLSEPQFIEKFSSEPWFPPPAMKARDVIKSFRAFMDALRADPELIRSDVHWAPQADLLEHPRVPYTHLGKVEEMDATVAIVRERVSQVKGASLPGLPRNNLTPLPYVDELFTGEDIELLSDFYSRDLETFRYERPPRESLTGKPPRKWVESVNKVAPGMLELRERNQRLADMHRLMKAGRQEMFQIRRQKIREEKLRREEQRRIKRLQKQLRKTNKELVRVKNSPSWKITAPLRKVSRTVKGAKTK